MRQDVPAEPHSSRRHKFYKSELPRLREHDPSLWADEPAVIATVANRLGWIDCAQWATGQIGDIVSWADTLVANGCTDVVLLGMGGSSLAPEVCRDVFERGDSTPRLHVLDNTHPGAISAVESAIDPDHTVFVVASKSGSTIETRCFADYFFEKMQQRHGGNAGQHFIAITDEGSDLQQQAGERKFSRIFVNPSDIGGRYSALSYFGLVPAAACGVDIAALVNTANAFKSHSDAATVEAGCPAVDLGIGLGVLAQAGRDKLTLLASSPFEPLGVWIEQLVAESTGKQGVGILPVTGEASRSAYNDDRVFAITRLESDKALADLAQRLRGDGHPVFEWTVGGPEDLGAEFFRWELATAVAGVVMGINPFDEPNVTESKNKTGELLALVEAGNDLEKGTADGTHDGLALFGASDFAAAIRNWAGAGDYIAVLAYGAIDAATAQQLEQLRDALGSTSGLPATLGFGPRFLHSTGQLHKGGAANGIFVQISSDTEDDLAIPGEAYTFGQLNACQALGDYQVLQARERRVVRVEAGTDLAAAAGKLAASL